MYGAQTHRLLWVILALIAINTAIFTSTDSLIAVNQPDELTYFSFFENAKNSKSGESGFNFERLGVILIYSIDLFIPLVDLQTAKKIEAKDLLLKAWSAIYILSGWLLVPLFLASITGVVKRQ